MTVPSDQARKREHADLLTERALRSGLEQDLDAARAATARYLTGAPTDPALWRDEGLLAEAAGDLDRAADAAARSLALDPDDPVTVDLEARLGFP